MLVPVRSIVIHLKVNKEQDDRYSTPSGFRAATIIDMICDVNSWNEVDILEAYPASDSPWLLVKELHAGSVAHKMATCKN